MKIKNILQFAMDNIARHIIFTILSIAMVCMSVLIICELSCEYGALHSSEIQVKDTINRDDSDILMLRSREIVDSEYQNKINDFFSTITDISGINVGEISCDFLPFDKEAGSLELQEYVRELEKSNIYDGLIFDEDMENTLYLPCVNMLNNVDICDLYTVDKEKIDFSKNDSKEYDQYKFDVYVGYSYRDILPKGTKLTREAGGNEYTINVVGVLEKGSKCVGEISYITGTSYKDAVYNLDNYVVMGQKTDGFVKSDGMYITSDKKSDKGLLDEVRSKAKDYEQYFYIESVEEHFESINEQFSQENNSLKMLLIFFTVVTIVSMIVIVAANIYRDKKTYGVFYAMGFSTRDIIKIISVEILMKYVLGAVIAYSYATVVSLTSEYEELVKMYKIALVRYVAPIVVVYVLVGIIFSGIIAGIIVSKKKPVQLIGGMRE